MNKKVLFITDTLEELDLKKDTSILMMEESIKLGFDVYQCLVEDLYAENNEVIVFAKKITTVSTSEIKFEDASTHSIKTFEYSFMRKDPPVDEDYINALHLLGLAQAMGTKVFNNPVSIKEFNEKVFAIHFAKYIPETLISSKIDKIKRFIKDKKEIVVKPLDGMGGKSIYKMDKIQESEIETLLKMTNNESTQIITQEFIEDIYEGDFRILIIHGKPFKKTLARIPQGDSFKGNLAAGGKGVVKDISDFQFEMASEIGDFLIQKDINFAGIDVIGNFLTEINVTSPTCARQILDQSGENPIQEYFEKL